MLKKVDLEERQKPTYKIAKKAKLTAYIFAVLYLLSMTHGHETYESFIRSFHWYSPSVIFGFFIILGTHHLLSQDRKNATKLTPLSLFLSTFFKSFSRCLILYFSLFAFSGFYLYLDGF